MLKAVLVDDEPLSLDALEFALDKHDEIEIIGKYTDPLEALVNIKKRKPELVFLDIEMPELDGFSAAEEIINMGLDTHIVFATVFQQYALKAFEINAADYIVKPFTETRLKLTVNRIIKNIQSRSSDVASVNTFVKNNLSSRSINKVAVWKENSIVLLDYERIMYFTMDGKRVTVHTKDGNYESSSTLAELEEKLINKGFFRCHKGYLINTDYIAKIIPWFNSTYMLKLKESTEQIPVSRYYAKKLKGLLSI